MALGDVPISLYRRSIGIVFIGFGRHDRKAHLRTLAKRFSDVDELPWRREPKAGLRCRTREGRIAQPAQFIDALVHETIGLGAIAPNQRVVESAWMAHQFD